MEMPGRAAVLHRRLIDALYMEAMLLADEARTYFDEGGRGERALLDPMARVMFSCESLKITTRLMHVIAWLLTQRAVEAGEIPPHALREPARMLGAAPLTEEAVLQTMPAGAQALVASSIDLYRRAERIEQAQGAPPAISPARAMIERLSMAL
jgi:regulator of CtrA degradation